MSIENIKKLIDFMGKYINISSAEQQILIKNLQNIDQIKLAFIDQSCETFFKYDIKLLEINDKINNNDFINNIFFL